jgi:hypothetical protein
MATKKISPKDPQAKAKVEKSDESKATARTTQNRQWRKMARKTAHKNWS